MPYEATCQDLARAVQDFKNAVNDWILRRQIAASIIAILPTVLPGWPLIDPDNLTNAELEAWVDALFGGEHACQSVFSETGNG